MSKSKIITADEIEEVLQTKLSDVLRQRCEKASLIYEEISDIDRDNYIREVVDTLLKVYADADTRPAGEHRIAEWEKGWGENLDAIKKGKNVIDLIPKYYGKRKLVRWRQRIIRPLISDFDYKILSIIVDWVVESFFQNATTIFEFGCGPAYHLLRARQYNPDAQLVGLDWTKASQEIIQQVKESGIETKIEGKNFNFFTPDYSINVPRKSGFLTVAALEQIGDNFNPFLDFIMNKKPSICVHLEPIDELLDQNNLIDRLSTQYFRKRNYLNGFLPRLRQLQEEGKIKIVTEQRTYSGSFFIEGHSLIVWYPL
ncbi:MAG: class I SAM-dependent methyltransferase [Bacteroidota bacterium]